MSRMAIFLLLLLVSTSIADNAGDKTGFLRKLNQIRREYAKKYNIPDMNELVWSQDLMEILEKLDWNDSHWSGSRDKWRWGTFKDYDSVSKEIQDKMATNLDSFDSKKGSALELLLPTQTVIGCGHVKNNEGRVTCLLGPDGKFWNFFTKDKGQRNTKSVATCSKHYTYKDGLCSPDEPSKVSYFGSSDDFLQEVNEIRRKYANDYGIPNMHELVWNKALVEIGRALKWSEPNWYRTTWRWTWLSSYRDPANQISMAMGSSKQQNSLGALELLEPTQTSIGCVPMSSGNQKFVVCLIGNQGTTTWDFHTKLRKFAGSECMEGYHNENGLCTFGPARNTWTRNQQPI